MRITSGILKNRQFAVPDEGLRPTTERTREAVFSSLAVRIPGARVLDLFAGAGSYGLEAWSRGAASVTAVEMNSRHWKILEKNFQTLEAAGLGRFQVILDDVYNYLKRAAGSFEFDLIFADPPYDEADLPRLLEAVGDRLAPYGLLVFEMGRRSSADVSEGWNLLKQKKYGSTQVLFLDRNPL